MPVARVLKSSLAFLFSLLVVVAVVLRKGGGHIAVVRRAFVSAYAAVCAGVS